MCPSFGERINHPILFFLGGHESPASQIGEVLGNFDLWFIKDFLEMTDAKWRSGKQMQNAQTRSIAKALIDLNQFHVA